MNFMQFQAKCISMFGLRIQALKMKAATNSVLVWSIKGAKDLLPEKEQQ